MLLIAFLVTAVLNIGDSLPIGCIVINFNGVRFHYLHKKSNCLPNRLSVFRIIHMAVNVIDDWFYRHQNYYTFNNI